MPEYSLDRARASLVVQFPDGTTAQIDWPEELDLLSGGLVPYAWAQIPEVAARDFFIRRDRASNTLALFGDSRLIAEYPDGRGGMVGLWRPSDTEVDYLAFEFGDWSVLVYDYRGFPTGARMSDADREVWAKTLHGTESEDGFLLLDTEPPLRLARAGAYPSPMSVTLHGPDGVVDLVPEHCVPGFVSPITNDDFAHWCDETGRISIRVTGTPAYQTSVNEGLRVGYVHFGGITAPDRSGSYVELAEALEWGRQRWASVRPDWYRLEATGALGVGIVDMSVLVRGRDVVSGHDAWPEPFTVEMLFERVEDSIASRADFIAADFHPELGFPYVLRGDPQRDTIDDEWGLEVIVQPLSD